MADQVDLPSNVAEALYWTAMEALNNSLKHAGAGHITIRLAMREPVIELEITDNGRGFEPERVSERMELQNIKVLTSYDDEEKISAAIRAGALGYVLKNTSAPKLFYAIRGAAMGSFSVSPDLTPTLLKNFQQPASTSSPSVPSADLTKRELEVLRGLARGYSNQQIARELGVALSAPISATFLAS